MSLVAVAVAAAAARAQSNSSSSSLLSDDDDDGRAGERDVDPPRSGTPAEEQEILDLGRGGDLVRVGVAMDPRR